MSRFWKDLVKFGAFLIFSLPPSVSFLFSPSPLVGHCLLSSFAASPFLFHLASATRAAGCAARSTSPTPLRLPCWPWEPAARQPWIPTCSRRCTSHVSLDRGVGGGETFDPRWEFFEQSCRARSPYPPHSPMFAFQRASSRYGGLVDADIMSKTPSTLLVAMLAASSSSWLLRAWWLPSWRYTRHGQDRFPLLHLTRPR